MTKSGQLPGSLSMAELRPRRHRVEGREKGRIIAGSALGHSGHLPPGLDNSCHHRLAMGLRKWTACLGKIGPTFTKRRFEVRLTHKRIERFRSISMHHSVLRQTHQRQAWMSIKFILLIVMTGFMAGFLTAADNLSDTPDKELAAAMNIAGRQRMLSQKGCVPSSDVSRMVAWGEIFGGARSGTSGVRDPR